MEPIAYIRALNIQLTYLFSYARRINEIDTAAALAGEISVPAAEGEAA